MTTVINAPVQLEAVDVDPLAHLLMVRVKGDDLHCTVHAMLPGPNTPQHWTMPYYEIMRVFGVNHAGRSISQAIDALRQQVGTKGDLPDWVVISSPRQH